LRIKTVVVLVALLCQSASFAGNEINTIGGRSSAMGGTAVCFSDFWSVNNNQAGIAYYKSYATGFYYENKFLLKELSLKNISLIVPTSSGVFGVNYSYFGYNIYNEQKLGIAYAKAFGKDFSAGIQLDYLGISIGDNYGTKNNITFEIGILAKLSNQVTIGAHAFNPINVLLSNYNKETIPSVLKLGMCYTISDKIILTLETEKNIYYNAVLKLGLEYKIIKDVFVRTGISTNPLFNTFGFGFNYGKCTFDFSSSIHQTLGYSPQFSMIYNFGK
jgi:hypothetical protein